MRISSREDLHHLTLSFYRSDKKINSTLRALPRDSHSQVFKRIIVSHFEKFRKLKPLGFPATLAGNCLASGATLISGRSSSSSREQWQSVTGPSARGWTQVSYVPTSAGTRGDGMAIGDALGG
jgi:hypothetical protein